MRYSGTSSISATMTVNKQILANSGRSFIGYSRIGAYVDIIIPDVPDTEPDPPITTTSPELVDVDYIARWSGGTLTVETADESTILETVSGNISGGGTLGFLSRTQPSGGASGETYLRSADGSDRVIRIIGRHQNAPFDGTRFRLWGAGSSEGSAQQIDNIVHLISFDSEGDDGGFLGNIDHANYWGGFEEVHYWNIYFWHDAAAGSQWCLSTNEDTSVPSGGEGTFHDPIGWIAIHSCTFNGTEVTNSENNIGRWYINGKGAASWLIEGVNTVGKVIKEHWAYLHYAQQAWIQNCSFGATGGTAIQFPNRHGRLEQPGSQGGCASDFAYGNRFMPPCGSLGPLVVRDNLVDEGEVVPPLYFRGSFIWSFFGCFSPIWLMRNTVRGNAVGFAIFTQDTPKGVWLTGPGVEEGVDWFATSGNSSLCGEIQEPEPGNPEADLPPGAYAFDRVYIEGNVVEYTDAHDREQMQVNGVYECIIGDNTINSDRQTLILDKGGQGENKVVNGTVCFSDRIFPKTYQGEISTYDPDNPESNTSGFYFFTLDELMAMTCNVEAPQADSYATSAVVVTMLAERGIAATVIGTSYIDNHRMGRHVEPDPTVDVVGAVKNASSIGAIVTYVPWDVVGDIPITSAYTVTMLAERGISAPVLSTSAITADIDRLVGGVGNTVVAGTSTANVTVDVTKQLTTSIEGTGAVSTPYPVATSVKVATATPGFFTAYALSVTSINGVTADMGGTSSIGLTTLTNRMFTTSVEGSSLIELQKPGVRTQDNAVLADVINVSSLAFTPTSINNVTVPVVAASSLSLTATSSHVVSSALTAVSTISVDDVGILKEASSATSSSSDVTVTMTVTKTCSASVSAESSVASTKSRTKIIVATIDATSSVTAVLDITRALANLEAISSIAFEVEQVRVPLSLNGLGERIYALEFDPIIKPKKTDLNRLVNTNLGKFNVLKDKNEAQNSQLERLIRGYADIKSRILELENLMGVHSGDGSEHNL